MTAETEDAAYARLPTGRYLCQWNYKGDHVSSIDALGSIDGCRYEYTLGYSDQAPLTQNRVRGDKFLYRCIVNTPRGRERFTSTDKNCEGQPNNGVPVIGAVWNTGGSGRHPVYRCRTWEGEHYDSIWSNCEGYQLEHMHGYMY